MNKAEAAARLQEIEIKYDLFFKVNDKGIADFFEIKFNRGATLKLKNGHVVPRTMLDDLKQYFILVST